MKLLEAFAVLLQPELEKDAVAKREKRRPWNVANHRSGRRPMSVDTMLKKEKDGTLHTKFAQFYGPTLPFTDSSDKGAAPAGKKNPDNIPSRESIDQGVKRQDSRDFAATVQAPGNALLEAGVTNQPQERTASANPAYLAMLKIGGVGYQAHIVKAATEKRAFTLPELLAGTGGVAAGAGAAGEGNRVGGAVAGGLGTLGVTALMHELPWPTSRLGELATVAAPVLGGALSGYGYGKVKEHLKKKEDVVKEAAPYILQDRAETHTDLGGLGLMTASSLDKLRSQLKHPEDAEKGSLVGGTAGRGGLDLAGLGVMAAPTIARLATNTGSRFTNLANIAGLGALAVPTADNVQAAIRARRAGVDPEQKMMLGHKAHGALELAGYGALAAPVIRGARAPHGSDDHLPLHSAAMTLGGYGTLAAPVVEDLAQHDEDKKVFRGARRTATELGGLGLLAGGALTHGH